MEIFNWSCPHIKPLLRRQGISSKPDGNPSWCLSERRQWSDSTRDSFTWSSPTELNPKDMGRDCLLSHRAAALGPALEGHAMSPHHPATTCIHHCPKPCHQSCYWCPAQLDSGREGEQLYGMRPPTILQMNALHVLPDLFWGPILEFSRDPRIAKSPLYMELVCLMKPCSFNFLRCLCCPSSCQQLNCKLLGVGPYLFHLC